MLDHRHQRTIVECSEADWRMGKRRHSGLIRHAFPSILGVLLAVAVVVAAISHHQTGLSEENASKATPANVAGLGPLDVRQSCVETVRAFLAAPTLEKKLTYVRRASSVQRYMERHYQSHSIQPVIPDAVTVAGQQRDLQSTYPLYIVAAKIDDALLPLIVENRNGRYLIDWESHAGHNPVPIERFLKLSGVQSPFRVYASLTDYYNFAYSDPLKYLALELRIQGRDEPLYAYLPRAHPDKDVLVRTLRGQKDVPMILQLRNGGGKATLNGQVLIERFIQSHWFVEEEELSYVEAWIGK